MVGLSNTSPKLLNYMFSLQIYYAYYFSTVGLQPRVYFHAHQVVTVVLTVLVSEALLDTTHHRTYGGLV